MNAICLVIDRLHAGCLGAYGNAWSQTPAWDRLASQALQFDHALLDSPRLDRLYRSYWTGRHALCTAPAHGVEASLAHHLGNRGVNTILLSDEPEVTQFPGAADFGQVLEIAPAGRPATAETVEQTHFAQCFMQVFDRLETVQSPFLLWCHLGGLGTTWDAPLNFREAYAEPGDPPPPTWAAPPERRLPADCDPDELLGVVQAYAGQVTLFDTCLGALLEFIDSMPWGPETLFVALAPRGFPLGKHGRLGPGDDALYGELVHVPWLMRCPGDTAVGARSQCLVEPSDLWATLLDWWQVAPPPSPTAHSLLPLARQETPIVRDRLCLGGAGAERAIRTPAWYLRAADEPELYAKPDDRWEVNNVAQRCHAVCERLQETLTEFEQAVNAGGAATLPPLDDVLLHGLD